MTPREFNDEITTVEDLREFCYDEGFEEYTEDFFDSEYLDDYLTDRVTELIGHERWYQVRDYLDDIPDCEYYKFDDDGCIVEFDDDDALNIISDLRQHLIEIGWFDDEEDDNEDYLDEDDYWRAEHHLTDEEFFDDDDELLLEDISINDLLFSPIAS